MTEPTLPPQPSLVHLRRRARTLHRALQAGDPEALARAAPFRLGTAIKRSGAQLVIARELGFASWPQLVAEVERRQSHALDDTAFDARLVALAIGKGWAAPRPAEAAALIADQAPAHRSLVTGLVAGDLRVVQQGLADADVDAPLGPWRAPPLAYAAASSLARLPAYRTALVDTVRWLLAADADPNGGWTDPQASGERLPVLYGAVARAGCLETVRALLAAGADPNDGESLYHATEAADRGILAALVEAGATWTGTNALLRQLDHDDLPGLEQALALGADPREPGPGGTTALHHALTRGRGLPFLRALQAAGADPRAVDGKGLSVAAWAAQLGEPEVLQWLESLGIEHRPEGTSAFVAACAAGDVEAARELAEHLGPLPWQQLNARQLRLLPDQAQRGRIDAVRLMLALGWPLATPGDWGGSALNQAAFRGDAALVSLLLSHGAQPSEPNGFGGDALGACLHAACHQPQSGGDYAAVLEQLLAHGAQLPDEDAADLPAPLRAVIEKR